MQVFRRRARGFSLVELLVVIAIIMLLLGLVGIVALKARENARAGATKGLIARIGLAMEEYLVHWRSYPTNDPDSDPDIYPNDGGSPAMPDYAGVELNRTILGELGSKNSEHFNNGDFDKNDDEYFVDAFPHPTTRQYGRIYYRKTGRRQMLLWSKGPDGVSQIGTGTDEEARLDGAGDDISSSMLDYGKRKKQ